MAFNFGAASMIFNVASSIGSGIANRKAVKTKNETDLNAWNDAYGELREQLGVSWERTQTQFVEANRAKIRRKLSARKAGHKAVGERATSAAQLGIAGRRGMRNIYAPVERVVADELSDAEIDAQTEMDTMLNHYNDTAQAAIAQLNRAAPLASAVPSIGGILAGSMGTALNTYGKMSSAQQTDFKNTFNFKQPSRLSSGYELSPHTF